MKALKLVSSTLLSLLFIGILMSCDKNNTKKEDPNKEPPQNLDERYISMKIDGKNWFSRGQKYFMSSTYPVSDGTNVMAVMGRNTSNHETLGIFTLDIRKLPEPLEKKTYSLLSGNIFVTLQKYDVDSNTFKIGYYNSVELASIIDFSVTITKIDSIL